MSNKKTKKAFGRKNSLTFQLVHRSQKDPLVADVTAPQRVLVPLKNSKENPENKRKYRVYFDNDYNYLTHLKDVNVFTNQCEEVEHLNNEIRNPSITNKFNINLPSSVFESNVQEKIGLLNKGIPVAGPQLDLDPDIVAALDDGLEFDPDDELEDNFVQLANLENHINKCHENDFESNTYNKVKAEIDHFSFDQYKFLDEETKSYFTEYSISSNVIRRNKELNFLDNKFEQMYVNYDENEIGDLDGDEIEGYLELNSMVVLQCAEKYEKCQKKNIENITKLMQNQMKIFNNEYLSTNENEIYFEKFIANVQEKSKWDCESIISSYSNTYNNPKLISEQKNSYKMNLNCKTGIPKNVLNKGYRNELVTSRFVKHQIEQNNSIKNESDFNRNAITSSVDVFNLRPKNETSEQRKNRKNSIKIYRKQRRNERKANHQIFKKEKKRQEMIIVNTKNEVQGTRIL
ncbi:PREDICTED: protein LTV1 homolog [Ceratosolen solmsi marchali]|uniref:Protein LTV1 homolog n=1 Tax=Ceratosolen solmsi marchali TaxID=326594 RepID=A0AAJ7E039_9HYME|nr:PREDICTED: protein LTV1 homolog [Ceratosolen solmsi marchali]